MALDPSIRRNINGDEPQFRYQAERYELDENTKTLGIKARDSHQSSYLGSFPSLVAPLSSDQQYIRTVSNVEFAKALLAQRPSPWTKPMFKLYCFIFVAFIASSINGYDSSVMGGINAMAQYQKYFHMKTLGSNTGIVFAIYSVGNFCGSFICGPISDSWGRRWGLFTGGAIAVCGTCVQATSRSRSQFILGRYLLGFGTSILTTAGPTYVAEIAHPAWRGTLTGLFNTWYFVGGMLATWIMYETEKLNSELAWRIPLWVQIVSAGLLMITCLWCPETPRWLVSNDRCEEAIRVITMYHGEGNRKSPIVLLSYKEMLEEIVISGSDKRWWDYSELYNTNAARWRMVCVLGMGFFSQWSGNGVVAYFMPVLLANIGISDKGTQLLLNAILMVLQFCVAIVGAFLVDRVGRRPMLLLGTSLFVVWWTIIGVLSKFYGREDNTNHGGARAVVAFIYLFGITHSFTYTPLQLLYPVECLSYETRAKGMGVYNFFVNIAVVFNTYGMSNIIEKINWDFCYIYIIWDVVELVLIYLLFVETKNRTLEEINEIFKSPNPKNKSLRKHVVVVTGEGAEEVNEAHETYIAPRS